MVANILQVNYGCSAALNTGLIEEGKIIGRVEIFDAHYAAALRCA